MLKKTVVIALGGNALVRSGQKGTIKEQLKNLDRAMEHVAVLVNKSHRMIITHGNGPQVGNLLLQQELAKKKAPEMPLYICVAQSQGQIGAIIQEVLYNKLHERKIYTPVVTVITQVLVDRDDSSFRNPSKPIGPYYSFRSHLPSDWHLVKTLRGYRRVVPSPRPKRIIEGEIIKKISSKAVVIASGGGGIPVVKTKGLKGIDAVIDKDLSAAKLANIVNADYLVMLTGVKNAYLNFGKLNQTKIGKIKARDLKVYASEGHFPKGSMGPKVKAAVTFVEGSKYKRRKAIITDFNHLLEAMDEEEGTIVVK